MEVTSETGEKTVPEADSTKDGNNLKRVNNMDDVSSDEDEDVLEPHCDGDLKKGEPLDNVAVTVGNVIQLPELDAAVNKSLQEFLEPAIGSEYCSSNVILSSLHQWVNETPSTSAQVSEERIQTFLNLVKKVPIKLWNEKVFAEIFLDDQRLRDNEMCRSFRDEFLSDLLEIANRKYLKRRAEDIVMKLKQRRIHEESAPSTSTETEMFTRSASTVHVKPATETPCGSGPKQIISGGDGSDCIGYFTSNENGSWFIGSFNLTTGDVRKITDFPKYREYGTLLHAYNYLYFIGGRILETSNDEQEIIGQVSGKIDVFDMVQRKWMNENLPQLKEARDDFQLCVIEEDKAGRSGFIYVLGGDRTDGSDVGVMSEFIPLYGMAKQKLTQEQTEQALRQQLIQQSFRQQQTKQSLHVFSIQGGIYNTVSGRLTPIPKIPDTRTEHSTAIYDSKCYVFGGVRSGSHKLASCSTYDNDTNVWTELSNMHRKRSSAATMKHNNFIYIVGGDGDDGKTCGLTIEKFDPTTNEFELIENWLDRVPSDVVFNHMALHIE